MADKVKITDVLPATAGNPPTVAGVFGLNSPWVPEEQTRVTNSFGTCTYNREYFATPEAAALVNSWFGGSIVPDDSFAGPSDSNPWSPPLKPLAIKGPGAGLINVGIVADMFNHGMPLGTIQAMFNNEAAAAGFNEDITLTEATPETPAPPVLPLVGGYLPGYGFPAFAFGPGAVPGIKGSTARVSSVDEAQPVNVYNDMPYTTPDGLKVIAVVKINSMFPGLYGGGEWKISS